ncbi:hypothetical protein [Mycobacteroides abscessus]|uniref:Uncharacterized protein n=1 Tax=Mycobacteroides abscessus subsp. bolletii 50594 TaxID=1303024 RepID=A0AB33AJ75_9MYCO|nr:hypothetical protein [Mycobacteroides abscessus]AGM31748.1 hypothetical protein MASS_2p0037 [Mycobacteroides abscessus subsp. bolletii 50594]MDO3032089.1 hypothetical protein [Mycobacteroides abscessus subsp. massiliense]MDO3042071.1 hypothetical protein [Mycobacteroides abscessus subsp. abscessus]MDO3111504.1 hypothetical protein [Mycobacteroides abscessus subsp. massiliense]SKU68468.1 Uncharacterised protein [Mycobacteroides abscessus subsp. massiliense]
MTTATLTPPTVLAPAYDELAVEQVVHDGLRLHLKGADRDEALRRMYGRVPTDIIRWRLFTTIRTVQRRVEQLGLTQHKEP